MLRVQQAELTAQWGRQVEYEEEEAGALESSGPSGWLSLPTDALELTLSLLKPRELSAVACCSRILRPLAEADANWSRLFYERFPRLARILGNAQPEWWVGGSWRQRYAALCCGAPFQAQVYNREQDNDQEDFLLSCYDATLRLAAPTGAACGAWAGEAGTEPTFIATYPAMGKMPVVQEQHITQQRLRAAPAACDPMEVYSGDGQAVSEGDEMEVQWKGRRSHPFGWWFGRVRSIAEGRLTLEFVQYPHTSLWRCVKAPLRAGEEALVNGDTIFGFMGGLRRLSPEEASEWWEQCPPQRIWRGSQAGEERHGEGDGPAEAAPDEEEGGVEAALHAPGPAAAHEAAGAALPAAATGVEGPGAPILGAAAPLPGQANVPPAEGAQAAAAGGEAQHGVVPSPAPPANSSAASPEPGLAVAGPMRSPRLAASAALGASMRSPRPSAGLAASAASPGKASAVAPVGWQ